MVVLANNQAPGTTLLNKLTTLSDSGQSLTQIAATLTASASFKSEYPALLTPQEFGDRFLANVIPSASDAVQLAGADLIEQLINSGSTRADIILLASTFLATPEAAADPGFGSAATTFQNKAEVAEFYTVDLELDTNLEDSLDGVTEDPNTVTDANETNEASTPENIADAEEDAAIEAATTASTNAAAANTTAAAAVNTAITDAGELKTAMDAAVSAHTTAAATAGETIAAALVAASTTATAAAAAAVTAKTTADENVVTAQATLATALPLVMLL